MDLRLRVCMDKLDSIAVWLYRSMAMRRRDVRAFQLTPSPALQPHTGPNPRTFSVLRKLCPALLIVAVVSAQARASNPAPVAAAVSVTQSGNDVTLSNGFVQLTFDRAAHRLIRFSADHTGHGNFRVQLLALQGLQIEGDAAGSTPATMRVSRSNPQLASVSFRWPSGAAITQLTLTLRTRARGAQVKANLQAGEQMRIMLRQWFLLGLFQRGAVQYIAGEQQHFSSTNPLRLFYTIDRTNGSVAVEPDTAIAPREVTLLSGANPEESGIVLGAQRAPVRPRDRLNVWESGISAVPVRSKQTGSRQVGSTIAFTLYGNDLPYPAYRQDSRLDGLSEARARDMAAYFTATYASAAGVLGSYFQPGSAYPTLAHPKRAYGDAFDFFDPDSWETVTTLAYSGDPLLQEEARRILERSEAAQRTDGQIPHHFVSGVPTFLSIAGSSQTGPNIFWTLAAIEYASATGNANWLRANYAHLRMATNWVLARYDPKEELVRADGPLFIDVFRRSGFTLDTNAFTYYLLARMSKVAAFCGDPATAGRYARLRANLRQGMLRNLWNGRDHFVTERHADGSIRDFVDYDGNFAALAFGVLPDDADAQKLLERLDSDPHTHPGGYGTWVSERRYNKQDCYLDNDGDSDVAMARIWWLDMGARVRMNDLATFNALLAKIENDLLGQVWLPERYDAEGRPAHNSYYHEYPEVFTMVLRTMRYGVHIDMQSISIHPFGVRRFSLHLGALRVDYSPSRISVQAPGNGSRTFTIAGLVAGQRYAVSTKLHLVADAQGALRFTASAGKPVVITEER